jgi:SH3 domain protein
MTKFYRFILVLFFITSSAVSFAETGYISDNVYTYLHTGPSAKFRIKGSIAAGTSINIIEHSEDGTFTKVSDNKGREGWIMSEFASTKQSLKQKYAALEARLNAQMESNQDLSQETTNIKQQTSQLQEQISQLTTELATAKIDTATAQAQLKGEDEDVKIKWLTRGALLVLVSFFIGVIVTSLISKKKSKSSWT